MVLAWRLVCPHAVYPNLHQLPDTFHPNKSNCRCATGSWCQLGERVTGRRMTASTCPKLYVWRQFCFSDHKRVRAPRRLKSRKIGESCIESLQLGESFLQLGESFLQKVLPTDFARSKTTQPSATQQKQDSNYPPWDFELFLFIAHNLSFLLTWYVDQ